MMKETFLKMKYNRLLDSGMFWKYFPNMTGNWKEDKDEWTKVNKELWQ